MEVGARLFKIFKQSWNFPFFLKKVVLAVECTINKEIFSREISFEADASMTRLIYIEDLCAQQRVKSTEYNMKSLWFQEEKWQKLVNLMVRRSLINFGKFSGEWIKVSWDDSTGVKQRKMTWWQFEGLGLLSCWLVCRIRDERRRKEWKSQRGWEQMAKMEAWS